MEDSIWHGIDMVFDVPVFVLILVVMEDSIWHYDREIIRLAHEVLILVVMEDSIWLGSNEPCCLEIHGLNPCCNGR